MFTPERHSIHSLELTGAEAFTAVHDLGQLALRLATAPTDAQVDIQLFMRRLPTAACPEFMYSEQLVAIATNDKFCRLTARGTRPALLEWSGTAASSEDMAVLYTALHADGHLEQATVPDRLIPLDSPSPSDADMLLEPSSAFSAFTIAASLALAYHNDAAPPWLDDELVKSIRLTMRAQGGRLAADSMASLSVHNMAHKDAAAFNTFKRSHKFEFDLEPLAPPAVRARISTSHLIDGKLAWKNSYLRHHGANFVFATWPFRSLSHQVFGNGDHHMIKHILQEVTGPLPNGPAGPPSQLHIAGLV